jgi:hypothetical protein
MLSSVLSFLNFIAPKAKKNQHKEAAQREVRLEPLEPRYALSGIETPLASETSSADRLGWFDRTYAVWHLNKSLDPGLRQAASNQWGRPGISLAPLVGDWDGDGIDSVGLYESANHRFLLKLDSPGGEALAIATPTTSASWRPISGDWNGDGVDTVGLYDAVHRSFYLSNQTDRWAEGLIIEVPQASAYAVPTSGDWNGDGVDTLGLFDPHQRRWYLSDQAEQWSDAPSTISLPPSTRNCVPVAGDWNGDGADTVGCYEKVGGRFYLSSETGEWGSPNSAPIPNSKVPRSWVPLAGKWSNEVGWSRTYGGPGYEEARSFQVMADGGYIVAGWTTSFGAGQEDVYIVRTDAEGNLIWQKTFGGPGDDRAYSIQPTTDGGYVIAGRYGDPTSQAWSAYVIKIDADGNELWSHTYGHKRRSGARDIQQTSDGGYIVAGWTGWDLHDSTNDVYLIRIDSAGNVRWSSTYGGPRWQKAHTVEETADGGFLVAGLTTAKDTGLDAYLLKTDAFGRRQWARSLAIKGWDEFYDVRATEDGGYVITGGTQSKGKMNPWVFKLNDQGRILWRRVYAGELGYAWSIEPLATGEYVFAGKTSHTRMEGQDLAVSAIDAKGNWLWTRKLGGDEYDAARYVRRTPSGNLVVAGVTRSAGAGEADFWLLSFAAP